jgi:predicted TIM-barrel fold metal-dependent hydrolase
MMRRMSSGAESHARANETEPPAGHDKWGAEPVDFVDCHVHFWDHARDGLRWPYLEPGFDHPRLKEMHRLDAPRFSVPELLAQAGDGVRLRKLVHVQSATEAEPGLESAWIESVADEHGTPHAIVARASLAAPDLATVVARNVVHPRVRGVRDMGSPGTIQSNEYADGFELLADAGLSVEILVPHKHFGRVAELAARRPDATVILGHAGQPEHRDAGYFAAWSKALTVLADRPNVVCKISAVASGADPHWTVASIRPWVERCIDVFGPHRAMLATNWPIDRLYATYPRLVAAYREITAELPEADRASLFGATAERVYRI